MASFNFRKQKSDTRTRRYSVEIDRMGSQLGRRKHTTGAEQLVPRPGHIRSWPVGTDFKAPMLPGEH